MSAETSAKARRYALLSGALALIVGLWGLPFAIARGPQTLLWGAIGWLLMAAVGVGGGWWMCLHHGKPGSRFMVALGTTMIVRLFLAASGAGGAALTGIDAVRAYLFGLVLAFLILQIFEVVWFYRASRSGGAASG